MAPYIPVPATIMVEWRYTFLGRPMENTAHFTQVGGWTLQNATTFAQALITWWDTYMAPFTSTLVTLREVYITDLSSQSGFAVAVTPGSTVTGDDADAPLPPQNALVVTIRTGSRGRSYRGRWFSVGATEQRNTGGQATQVYADGLQTALGELRMLAENYEAFMVVVSRRTNNQPRVTGVPTLVTSTVVRDLAWDTMRSRALGSGS